MPMTTTADAVRAVVRLRTLGPSGLNPPQTEVIDRLEALSEDGPITDLDIGIWGVSMGITQTDKRDPVGTRETVTEFRQWANEHGYTLRPAFDWHSGDSEDARAETGQIVTPLVTLAVYDGERLRAVYPHVDGEEVNSIHDGLEALESMTDGEQTEDEESEKRTVPLQ